MVHTKRKKHPFILFVREPIESYGSFRNKADLLAAIRREVRVVNQEGVQDQQ